MIKACFLGLCAFSVTRSVELTKTIRINSIIKNGLSGYLFKCINIKLKKNENYIELTSNALLPKEGVILSIETKYALSSKSGSFS